MAEDSIEAGNKDAQEAAAVATATAQAEGQVAKKRAKRAPRAQRATVSTAKKGKGVRAVLVHAKRKEAVARASIKEGHGMIRINGFDINTMQQKDMVSLVMGPIRMSDITAELAGKLDISVNVNGGGFSAQMQAARNAIAKGMVEYTGSDSIRKLYAAHNKYLLTDDYRRVEPKKYKGPKARARFQTSYR